MKTILQTFFTNILQILQDLYPRIYTLSNIFSDKNLYYFIKIVEIKTILQTFFQKYFTDLADFL